MQTTNRIIFLILFKNTTEEIILQELDQFKDVVNKFGGKNIARILTYDKPKKKFIRVSVTRLKEYFSWHTEASILLKEYL